MARKSDSTHSSRVETWLEKAVELLSFGATWISSLKQKAGREAEAFAARVSLQLLLRVWISAGVWLCLWGLMELLIEQAVLPAGVVHSMAGALIALTALLTLHFAGKGA